MTLFDLTGPLGASMGIGVLLGIAHENHESTPVLGLLIVGGLVAGLGLSAASRNFLRHRPPRSEAQAAVALIFTVAVVLTGTLLAGDGMLHLVHHAF